LITSNLALKAIKGRTGKVQGSVQAIAPTFNYHITLTQLIGLRGLTKKIAARCRKNRLGDLDLRTEGEVMAASDA
jgi:hypothetical protein